MTISAIGAATVFFDRSKLFGLASMISPLGILFPTCYIPMMVLGE